MELSIFDSIIFGSLQPWQTANQNEQIFFDLLRQVGRNVPSTADELDKKLRALLRHHPDAYKNINTSNNIALAYPLLENVIPRSYNNITEYYFLLTQLSSLRIMNDLIANVHEDNHDIDNYYLVNTTLDKIKYIAAAAAAELARLHLTSIPDYAFQSILSNATKLTRNTHSILFATKQHAIRLYFEMQDRFFQYIKTPESIEQFYTGTLKEAYSQEMQLKKTTHFFNRVIKTFMNADVYIHEDALQLMVTLSESYNNNLSSEAIIALDNFIFANLFNLQIENVELANLANFATSAKFFEDIKQSIVDQINLLSYGFQRFEVISNVIDKISFYKQVDFTTNSSLLKLQQWLALQSDAYKGNLSNSFAVTAPQSQIKSVKPHAKISKRDIEDSKQQAQEFLKHFSGHNIHQQKIMSEIDYTRLIEYTFHLLEHGKLPKTIKQIPTISLSGNHIRYSYYQLHKKFFGTKEIKSIWIDFLHEVFFQLSTQNKNTLKTKFSVKPSNFDQDINAMNA